MRYQDAHKLKVMFDQYEALVERLAAAEAKLAELSALVAPKKPPETLSLRSGGSRGRIN